MVANRTRALDPIEGLTHLGFSEYEAKAYLALLRQSPITGYQLSKLSGVPRSMIYEVLGKLTARGAAMTLRAEGGIKYAPTPAEDFLDQLQREHDQLVATLKQDLSQINAASDLDYVWSIEGHGNVMAKAEEMIAQANNRICIALLPVTFQVLRPALEAAVARDVRVVVYTTGNLDLPGARVVASSMPERASVELKGLWLIMVIDGEEALIGELLTQNQARASWTGSPLFVFVAEHHLRTDLYLPRVLALLGDRALDIIQEEDQDLFAYAFESRLEH
ncbi:MAG: TrmB family transcriptional regulator [Anaerolineae bacterium]|nr:TrmB family transcriptional regulator [Anaerolineae bacterium]